MAHLHQTSRIGSDLEFHSQCTAAISAHGDWKFKLKQAVKNRAEGLDPEKVQLDNQCAFGQWLYSSSTIPLRSEKDYENVLHLHAAFHQEAAAVIRLCRGADIQAAEDQLKPNSPYAKVSAQLTDAVRSWMRTRQTQAASEIAAMTDNENATVWHRAPIYGMLIGAAAGLGFVVASLAITFGLHALPWAVRSIASAHQLSPNNWLVDCAPPILGFLGYSIGRFLREQKQQASNLQILVEKRTEQLAVQQRDLRRIFENLEEGIFTIAKNRQIGTDYSPTVESIFQNTEISGNTIKQIFTGRVDQATLTELDGYLDLLFDGSHKESMLRDLNPFQNLRTADSDSDKLRIINVHFQRLLDGKGQVDAVLAIARDVTTEQLLREELSEQQNAASGQMAMIREIFEIGPEMLMFFRNQVETELNAISLTLRSPGEIDLRQALEGIFRRMHSIKGSAALLGLSRIADEAHKYEDKISEIQRKEEIDQMDFLPLMISHASLLKELDTFERLLKKIQDFQQRTEAKKSDSISLLAEILQRLSKQSAEENDKKVRLVFGQFTPQSIPEQWSPQLRDILTQLIRNSIAHGIETPDARRAAGKDESGTIRVSAIPRRRHIALVCRDDGGGFAVERIRERILERSLLTQAELGRLSDSQAVEYIFQPGFSTADSVDMNAGRGVGMDLVREKLRNLNGKIRIQWKKGVFTQFVLLLPTPMQA